MKGTARDAWLGVLDDDPVIPVARGEAVFRRHLESFRAQFLDEMAAEDQIEYLRTTKKPKSLPVKEWIRRMKTINNYLPFMADAVRRLTEEELIRNCITPNIPFPWKKDFKLG